MGSVTLLKNSRKALYNAYLDILKADDLWHDDREAALSYIVQKCAQTLSVARVGMWRFNDAGDRMVCQMLYDNGQCRIEPTLFIVAQEHPNYFGAIEANRAITINDTLNDPITETFVENYLKPLHIGAMLDATILQAGETVGILCIEHTHEPREWTAAERSFAIAIADILSQVLIANTLFQTQERYQKVFNSTTDAILLMQDRRLVDCNEPALKMFGCTREEYFRQSATRFWPEYQPNGEPSRQLAQQTFESVGKGEAKRFEWLHRRFDGTEFYTEVDLNQIYLNEVPHFVICIRDITQRKHVEQHIQSLLSMQQAIFDGASYSIISTDLNGNIMSFNRAAEEMLGYSAEEVIQTATLELFHDSNELNWRAIELTDELKQTINPGFDPLIAKAREGNTEEREWTYIHRDGKRIPVLLSVTPLREQNDQHTGYLCVASDISIRKRAAEALEQSRRDMEHRANHDELTDLPNRARLHDQTQSAICTAQTKQIKVAMLLIDLDRFKEVNDTLGHSFGDDLIKRIGERLNAYLESKGAVLYRLGGDEFAVLVPEVNDIRGVDKLVDGVHRTLRESIAIRDIHMEMAGSVGISIYPDHGGDSHSLLRCADVAMYKAKTSSGNTVYYQPQTDGHSPRRLTMMSELGHAIRNDQLTLHYQPRIAIADQHCVGCEALVRWEHPKLGMIPPFEFIPLAEVSDQIQPLAYWVLQTALKQARKWLDQGLRMVISVNLSTRNLMDITIPDQIEHLLKESNVPPELLEVEITESTLIDDPDRALLVIDRIHKLGVSFAIDDFGTGYSSLSYLKRLPISTLKIDRSFIKDMLTDEQDAVIVRSTLGLAHSFGLEVVAEGVEDRQTLAALRALQCEQVQGYFYSKPVPATDFEHWLTKFHK